MEEEVRRHCTMLLATVAGWSGEEVEVVGREGRGGEGCRLLLAAASPLLRPWLEEGGDLVLLPHLPSSHLHLLCTSLINPLVR